MNHPALPRVLNATPYSGFDMPRLGRIVPAHVRSERSQDDDAGFVSSMDSIDADSLAAVASKMDPDLPVCFEWEPDIHLQTSAHEMLARMHDMTVALDHLKAALRPGSLFGLYRTLPPRLWWPHQLHSPYIPGRADRDLKRVRDLIGRVTAMFPSLYTFYDDDRVGWTRYAIGTARLCDVLDPGREVPRWAYMWPRYHNSNKRLAHEPEPIDDWRYKVRLALDLGFGVAVWDDGRGVFEVSDHINAVVELGKEAG